MLGQQASADSSTAPDPRTAQAAADLEFLRALTETPAVVFGRTDRGRIATGMAADLVLWSGDPLELSTTVDAEWIGGRRIELVSRQTDLLKKYRTLR